MCSVPLIDQQILSVLLRMCETQTSVDSALIILVWDDKSYYLFLIFPLSELFLEAVDEFHKCLEIQQKYLEPDDRLLAETYSFPA